MIRAFMFPGQGSQSVGMGKELAESFTEARLVFEEVDEALKQKLSALIFAGPIEELTLTENTQPALMAVSVAAVRVLEKQAGKPLNALCAYVAGHSLGEYSALCTAGALSLADTARLLRIRGNAMQKAVPAGQGGMAALLGVEFPIAQQIAERARSSGICQAANDNGGGQVVISGALAAIDRAVEVAAEFGVKRAVKLPVSAPFHCEMMVPAAEAMLIALGEVAIKSPSVPVIANVTAQEVTHPEEIKDLLVKQVTGMVRWRESVEYLAGKGVTHLVELGAGKVLAGLAKRIDKNLEATSIQTPQDVESFLSA